MSSLSTAVSTPMSGISTAPFLYVHTFEAGGAPSARSLTAGRLKPLLNTDVQIPPPIPVYTSPDTSGRTIHTDINRHPKPTSTDISTDIDADIQRRRLRIGAYRPSTPLDTAIETI